MFNFFLYIRGRFAKTKTYSVLKIKLMKHLCLLAVLCAVMMTTYAQNRITSQEIIRCYTTEADEIRRAQNPNIGTLDDFERWLAPLVIQHEENASAQRAVTTIPIIFHIIHNGGSDNISATYVNAQINQLNEDFRKIGDGSNNHPDGADSEIEFCAATVDENGNTLAEPGINRVSRSAAGFSTPPYSQSYYESTIKPNTIWDATQYCNVWVSDLSGGLLGYAQFPEASSLPGIGTGNGGANTDGVVILYSSVGSVATPHPLGGVYDAGRTLTHELGHWLGLRHIWGDGGCSVDDYCDDTPRASGSTSGCPSNQNTCDDTNYGLSTDPNDMVENYMDYSYDACMNIFTTDQKTRMQIVMSSSVRRASLATSTKCGSGTSDTEAPSTPTNLTASNITSNSADLSWNASSDNIGVTGYDVYIDGSLLGTVTGTSTSVTGLSANTGYNATVRAKDAAGNQSGSAATSFTTLAQSCFSADLVLTINLDNYPEETSWSITSGGSTVASGGTYGSQPDGSTVTENINLADGDYTFTINDAYGDGICCGYGNGSYSLTSGGTTIISGGSFGTSESETFCVEGGGSGSDTQAPSNPTNVSASNITQTSATISWNASSDNVGVVSYNVSVGGSLVGNVAGTSTSLTGLTANTGYAVSVTALDAAGNESGSGSTSFTTLGDEDTQAPNTPTNVSANNITQTTADVSWNASTDNVGVTSYNVSVDGSFVGNVSGTSTSLGSLTANTNYSVSVTALDAAGNESGSGSTSFTTLSNSGGGTDELFAHYFESGWDGWTDGGGDCARVNSSRSYEGVRSIRIRDNSGTSSSMTLNNVDVTGYDQLELTFFFYPNSMENGEDFWLRVDDGSGWQTVATYASGTDFSNNSFYTSTVVLNAGDFNFNSGFDFRFQCDASGNADRIYIDQVSLAATTNARSNTEGIHKSITQLDSDNFEQQLEIKSVFDASESGLLVYPNPATNFINVLSKVEANSAKIYSLTGTFIKVVSLNEEVTTIDISELKAGAYLIFTETNDGIEYQRFIKY